MRARHAIRTFALIWPRFMRDGRRQTARIGRKYHRRKQNGIIYKKWKCVWYVSSITSLRNLEFWLVAIDFRVCIEVKFSSYSENFVLYLDVDFFIKYVCIQWMEILFFFIHYILETFLIDPDEQIFFFAL